MNVIWRPSPNSDSREGCPVSMLVLHYTGMKSAENALSRLCDPASSVSAHYVVDEDGGIYQLVKEQDRAWHAGVSAWRGETRINHHSIGIEIVNPGHELGYRPFPDAQMHSVIVLCKDILSRHPIPARNVVGHSDVAPARKEDPGELFDWAWLARERVGLWPDKLSASSFELPASKADSRQLTANSLSDYGYDISDLSKAIIAFQRHFRPQKMDGEWDSECELLLADLMRQSI